MSIQQYGVAPTWVDTSDASYSPPSGWTGIGIVSSTDGTISIVNNFGDTVELTLSAGVPFSTHFRSLTPGTATGVLAALIK